MYIYVHFLKVLLYIVCHMSHFTTTHFNTFHMATVGSRLCIMNTTITTTRYLLNRLFIVTLLYDTCTCTFGRCFLVCRLDKLLSWFSTQTSVVNFRYYLFCLCNVRRQYMLPGILGIYCCLTGVPSLPAIALPKGRICSLVNQVYTSFPLMSLPPFGLHWPNVG